MPQTSIAMTAEVFLYTGQPRHDIPRSIRHVKVDPSIKEIPEKTFLKFESLSTVDLPEGLLRIDVRAFEGCRLLRVLTVPSTVVEVRKRAFAFCYDLTSVEFAPQGLESLGEGVFHYCVSLVNVRLPSSVSDFGTGLFEFCAKLHQQFPEGADIVLALQKRFLSLPLHELCYEQAYESSEETLLKLKLIVKEAKDGLGFSPDCFGMTPLHVLSLSHQHSDTTVFSEIMKLRLDDLMTKDQQGKLPLHYVCLSNAPVEIFRLALDTQCTSFPNHKPDWKTLVWITETVETYKYVVHSSVEDRVRKLGLFAWREDIRETVESIGEEWRFNSRPRHLRQVHSKLVRYEKRETLLILKLALWKAKIDEVTKAEAARASMYGVPSESIDREHCLVCCSDELILSSILPFLESQRLRR
ncbi:unnamed protein product [Cylindrotheca closterium]|uniref:Uncharacterized protein n=1 Tax=Cylindrotheca closterium TaxID=2856 RepID=A0AAD2FHI5_9STRA|nr:unnamed protein product [Cylindrotheca closterium]